MPCTETDLSPTPISKDFEVRAPCQLGPDEALTIIKPPSIRGLRWMNGLLQTMKTTRTSATGF